MSITDTNKLTTGQVPAVRNIGGHGELGEVLILVAPSILDEVAVLVAKALLVYSELVAVTLLGWPCWGPWACKPGRGAVL